MKTRLWCFTNFAKLDLDYESLISDRVRYIAFGEEKCSSTGRTHHQGFIYFKNPQSSKKNVAKLLHNSHVEQCHGSLFDNETYCSKEGTLQTFGIKPSAGRRTDIIACMDAIKEGVSEVEIAESNPQLWCQYGRRFETYRALLQPKRRWKSEVYVFWGPAGTGKSHEAWRLAGDQADSVKFANSFAIGYKNAPNVILDDLEPWSIERQTLLQLLDEWPCTVNVKGNSKEWNPRKIYITTNLDPNRWFTGTTQASWMRRLSHVQHFENRW